MKEDEFKISENEAYSLLNEVRQAFKRFKSKNELQYQDGANEEGCPKNYVRSKTPRKNSPHLKSGKEPKNRYRGGGR